MAFKNEYVPPRDKEGAAEFVRKVLAESEAKNESRRFPHPLEHYSVREHRISKFVLEAREKLRTGYSVWDMWTIDHELGMVLQHSGSGREEGAGEVYWKFIDRKGLYSITTIEESRSSIQSEKLEVTYRIRHFWVGHGSVAPDAGSLKCFKQALDEYHRYSLFNFNAHPERRIVLVDGRTDTEI